MMKYIYKMLACATFIIGLSSCGNDWLDVSPGNGVDAEEAITSSSDLNTAVIGMYQMLKGTSDFTGYYAARMFYYGEVRGEDMQAEQNASRSMTCYNMTYSTDDDAPIMWHIPYIVIGRANQIIRAAESGELTDHEAAADIIAQYHAEAKVIRALAHFDLVRIYGKTYTADDGASWGVPVVTTVFEPEDKLSRHTVAQVYTQVIKDLTEAIASNALPETKTPGYVNVWAAKALLARVYLTQGNNSDAFDTAEDVILHSPFKLWENDEYVGAWAKADAAHTNEMLFELAITGANDWTDREGIASLYAEGFYGDVITTQKFLNMLNQDPDDVRLGLFLAPQTDEKIKLYGTNRVYLNKLPPVGTEVRHNNIPLIRLSEVYLIAAEAAAKMQETDDVVEYLGPIVNRANPAKHIADSDATLEQVLVERRKELIGEGHRFFDAMRNNETITRYTSSSTDQGWHLPLKEDVRSFNRDFYKTLLPIPAGEMNANPAMAGQQNPGYGS